MNGLERQNKMLPDTLDELSKFVLVGREKLNAVRAEIRAIEKVQLAAEVHEQKLQEAQEIAEAVLDAETKLGELTSQMETAQGKRKDLELVPISGTKSKKEQLADLGISHHERFETLAKHPETVEKAKADARAEGRIVTRQDVLNRIMTPKEKRNPSMEEVVEEARQEHEQFREARKESVVNFEDIRRDNENKQFLACETEVTIRKILQAIGKLVVMEDEVKELSETLTTEDRTSLTELLTSGIRTLTHVLVLLGGK